MRTPAVLYAAKSTQDKKRSIPTQLEHARKKAAEEGWEVIGEFKDEAFSAYSGNRGPGLKAATELAAAVAAERGVTCMLVAQHSDRFARGAGDRPGAADSLIEIWTRMRRADVHLRTYQNDAMMDKPVTVAVASEQAHEESKRKSESTADGHRRRRKEGKAHGGKRRFGYDFGEDAALLRRAEEAVIIERAFDEFIAGASDSEIMRGLVGDNIATALGGRWHEATVRDLLTNPLYAGMLRTKDGVIPGRHQACVSLEKFEKAQQLRAARNKTGKGRGRPSAGKHLFRKGMLRCGCGCEGSMVPRTIRPGKSRPTRAIRERYVSYERLRDPRLCTMPYVDRAQIDTAVYSYFEQVALDVEATRQQLAEARDRKLAEVRMLRSQAEAERHRAEERLARVRRDYLEDRISAEDWASFRDELGAELQAAKAEADRLVEQAEEVERWGALHDAEQETLQKLADLRAAVAGEINDPESVAGVRASLARLFDHFVLKRIEPGQRVHAELAWLGEFYLEPVILEQAVEGYTDVRPIFRREPIYDGATNQGSPSSCPAPPRPMG
jgi:DNA invertase Pin-like site-specific DNA recombinase